MEYIELNPFVVFFLSWYSEIVTYVQQVTH
jgi:hypothetical protein